MNMKKQIFKIIKKDKKTKARIGILNTKKGKIKTPFFMPVATKATGKFVSSMKLNEVSNAIISNSLILSINPGEKRIKNAGGIGKFMNYKGINFTDSGGFQMYSRSLYKKSNENGVYFKNPLSGETIFMTPEKNIEIQNNIGAEVIMCLDRMPLYSDSKKEIENAIILTTKWAKRCKIHHEKIQNKIPQKKRQLLFAITQGGIYKDLRQKSAKDLLKLDFDGYAIGGIALPKSCYENINKAKKLEHNAIKIHKKIIPENKICYVMGEGDPYWLVEAISLGCDVFDSKFPTECARRGTLFTSLGKIKILNKKFESDKNPIDKKCSCFVCKNYTKAYIRYLLKQNEAVGKELTSYHNLYYINELFKNIRKAIINGNFLEYKNEIKKSYIVKDIEN